MKKVDFARVASLHQEINETIINWIKSDSLGSHFMYYGSFRVVSLASLAVIPNRINIVDEIYRELSKHVNFLPTVEFRPELLINSSSYGSEFDVLFCDMMKSCNKESKNLEFLISACQVSLDSTRVFTNWREALSCGKSFMYVIRSHLMKSIDEKHMDWLVNSAPISDARN